METQYRIGACAKQYQWFLVVDAVAVRPADFFELAVRQVFAPLARHLRPGYNPCRLRSAREPVEVFPFYERAHRPAHVKGECVGLGAKEIDSLWCWRELPDLGCEGLVLAPRFLGRQADVHVIDPGEDTRCRHRTDAAPDQPWSTGAE